MLLGKDGALTKLLVHNYHETLSHAGLYTVLKELRKKFWIPHYYSSVKKIIRRCVSCRRFKERPIQLNQSPYRDFRKDPPQIPFRYLFLDFMGPFTVKGEKGKFKVWILCCTCMWSRAINLKLSLNLTTKEFLRSFQLHCFDFGVPQFCISDLGTQLTAGANTISDHQPD